MLVDQTGMLVLGLEANFVGLENLWPQHCTSGLINVFSLHDMSIVIALFGLYNTEAFY